MSASAGWGDPPNTHDEPTHWWMIDNRRACDPDDNTVFGGHKNVTFPMEPCLECAIKVAQSAMDTERMFGVKPLRVQIRRSRGESD